MQFIQRGNSSNVEPVTIIVSNYIFYNHSEIQILPIPLKLMANICIQKYPWCKPNSIASVVIRDTITEAELSDDILVEPSQGHGNDSLHEQVRVL